MVSMHTPSVFTSDVARVMRVSYAQMTGIRRGADPRHGDQTHRVASRRKWSYRNANGCKDTVAVTDSFHVSIRHLRPVTAPS